MRFPISCPIHVVMLGCGGTGGHIAPHLYRLLYAVFRPSTVILCDGDIVEKNNLVRQNFVSCDLGRNKAEVLAERYSAAFGMACRYMPRYIESEDELRRLLQPEQKDALVILLGCVDNNRSRRMCNEVFYQAKNLVYIDSGNGLVNGQVVCGVRKGGRTLRKPVAGFYPDILDPTDKFPSELSCAEASVSSPQAMTANLMAATLVLCMLYNIIAGGELDTRMTTFSSKTVNVRPLLPKRRAA
ncbi:hypothetical protein AGATL06_24910 [Agathobaculum sp. TL06]